MRTIKKGCHFLKMRFKKSPENKMTLREGIARIYFLSLQQNVKTTTTKQNHGYQWHHKTEHVRWGRVCRSQAVEKQSDLGGNAGGGATVPQYTQMG